MFRGMTFTIIAFFGSYLYAAVNKSQRNICTMLKTKKVFTPIFDKNKDFIKN